jgi:uncharacterized protein
MFPIRLWRKYGGKNGKAGSAGSCFLGCECPRSSVCAAGSDASGHFLVQDLYAIVWWATPVEIASALARLARMSLLDTHDWAKANKLAKGLAGWWSVIQPSDALRATAMQLVERHDLRAADSFQLAAALEWCEHAPQGRVFLTTDQKLREAALLSGFDAKQL